MYKELPSENNQQITFEVNGSPVNMRINDVSFLFIDLDKYNYQFSMGAMMARALGNIMRINDSDTNDSLNVVDEETSQQANAFFLASAHKNTLENLGLALEPISGSATMFVEGQTANDGQMRLNVVNGDNLVAFLGALQVGHLETTGIKSDLNNLSSILTRQVADRYNFTDMVLTDEMFQLFGNIEKIIEDYKRLGLPESVEQLSIYLEHGKAGDLREYIFIERAGLFKEPGHNFGPADWQVDSTPASLRNRWNGAIYLLQLTKENPKASDLFAKLHRHLSMCVEIAINKVEGLTYLNTEQKTESKQVLTDAKTSLEAFTN